ncbi:MAG: asparaginase [Rubrivivax sp.]|nr:asparaginase [Rubrivivax sp.]
MPSPRRTLVVLATGGTIAGRAANAHDNVGYRAAALGVDELLHALPGGPGLTLETEDLARLDSKDMDHATWLCLVQRLAHHLARAQVQGAVVTHGTDTLEETAWLLHRVLAPRKPVVLTAAMRPASSLQADGPQNLADALAVAAAVEARGVLVVLAGQVFGAGDARKRHSWRLDAFTAGDAGAIAAIEQGALRRFREWPSAEPIGLDGLPADSSAWPWVEIVTSHAGARGAGVDALVHAGVRGLVVAGTGNATVHVDLAQALQRAQAAGVVVRLVTRCAAGPVLAGRDHRWPVYAALSAPQARVELMLELMQES